MGLHFCCNRKAAAQRGWVGEGHPEPGWGFRVFPHRPLVLTLCLTPLQVKYTSSCPRPVSPQKHDLPQPPSCIPGSPPAHNPALVLTT